MSDAFLADLVLGSSALPFALSLWMGGSPLAYAFWCLYWFLFTGTKCFSSNAVCPQAAVAAGLDAGAYTWSDYMLVLPLLAFAWYLLGVLFYYLLDMIPYYMVPLQNLFSWRLKGAVPLHDVEVDRLPSIGYGVAIVGIGILLVVVGSWLPYQILVIAGRGNEVATILVGILLPAALEAGAVLFFTYAAYSPVIWGGPKEQARTALTLSIIGALHVVAAFVPALLAYLTRDVLWTVVASGVAGGVYIVGLLIYRCCQTEDDTLEARPFGQHQR